MAETTEVKPAAEVKPSESGKKEPEPTPAKEKVAEPAPKPAEAPPILKAESKEKTDDGASSKLVADLTEKLRVKEDQLSKTQMELAQIHATRQRLTRVFKPGFKVRKS